MRNKLAVAAGGLVLAIAFGVPAGAQAAVTPSRSAQVKVAAVTPEANPPCNSINDRGNGKYATALIDDNFLYFEAQDQATNYCNVTVSGIEGAFEIEDEATGGCVAPESSATQVTVHEDTPTACADNANGSAYYPWDDWFGTSVGTYHSQTVWLFSSLYNDGCLYDDLQEPAITTGCGAYQTDTFEHFIWDALP